ncbi:uncharacterized protein OCT59_023930 [Rhizophagus irregularis]|uniref:F-box domain-containing protein n=1 Tax=Rhizophagus irregularis (strain DAOM 181602 / DAOM 197198 / MUCL 43194) TaxID=747089 RepID=A0A2H5RVB2_RHIID|nr:hypothetical protein GLOIN_2v1878383 [Rhizophagus irregularis DAOM 181602=DAOM 197198]PKY25967.1 hypothetical protein RhiirB3_441107 [Rhizophagus irregularis]POG68365.1 hypothetical protein GLOIN_2v1878383 [Rhizophagus irregularis DAOM 181602=DAOM 197198]UZO03523.1 hypothetical protein OCT59_023930 [Rhizophagus irregularis]GBC22019.1 hypothetical protein GLOIN_2v1878383 [Rhizophagus irregularis DAOM 181602=DAOM 197198]|eukprot:XP_025175231.1 hypothetical protein GLOIN_2v1878383 [Rhizophagus irregularis DAOM 181602=DAOM 197198]
MTCSKIFSGDLPELTYGVIKYFQNDHSTLYSCTLINRLWCRLAIPLLWENPFSSRTGNYNFIEIYLHNITDDIKTELNECKIINNSLPSNTLFNYLKFLKYLNTFKFIISVEKWVETAIKPLNPEYRASDIRKLINISLFKIFIENEVNLHTLEIEISGNYYYPCLNTILGLILKSINFIHNIRNLNLYINTSGVLKNDNNDYIFQIINLHQNLKRIFLRHNNFPLYQSLLLSKDYNCSNTLNTIIFYCVDFNSITNLNRIFERLNVLESVHIIKCTSLNNDFTKQIINLTKSFKLKSLFINELLQIESLQLLLQKFGDYLENFGYEFGFIPNSSSKQKILELIIKYCKNIKYLDLIGNDDQIIYPVLYLIESIKQNLNHLSISTSYDSNGCSSIILQNLGQHIPYKLEYLHLFLHHIKIIDFEVFLKNSQNTFIKKLLIYSIEGQDILPSIKKYILKKKRVEYLSFFITPLYDLRGHSSDLSSFNNEVKEFGLYNIKVQSYSSLVIRTSDFIKGN